MLMRVILQQSTQNSAIMVYASKICSACLGVLVYVMWDFKMLGAAMCKNKRT